MVYFLENPRKNEWFGWKNCPPYFMDTFHQPFCFKVPMFRKPKNSSESSEKKEQRLARYPADKNGWLMARDPWFCCLQSMFGGGCCFFLLAAKNRSHTSSDVSWKKMLRWCFPYCSITFSRMYVPSNSHDPPLFVGSKHLFHNLSPTFSPTFADVAHQNKSKKVVCHINEHHHPIWSSPSNMILLGKNLQLLVGEIL